MKNKKGFTLIELMVVIAIIGILATTGVSMYGTYQAKARDTKRISNLNSLTIGLQGFYTDKSEYPNPKSANCLSDSDGVVHEELKSYYDGKKIPMDPQKARKAGGCDKGGSPFYKMLSKDSVAKTAYVLGSNVEVKSNANYLYQASDSTYESTSTKTLSDRDRNSNTASSKQNILYAIINN